MRFAGSSLEQAIAAETDIFERDQFGAGLLNLFESSDDPLVVALDEKWGTGKTVFARRLEKQATDKGFTVIYFDAFKRDYDPDVFIALSAELLAKIPENSGKSSLKHSAKAVGKTIGKLALKGGVRLLTAGALKAGDFDDANQEVAEDMANMAEAELDVLIDRRLDNARMADETFGKFKRSLEALTNSPETQGDGKPLLFIVDELDRCRPDYALSVLETIKHFFSVPYVHFLLVCDMEQLVAAVHKRYGLGGHGDTYLEKFIDLRVYFPVLDHNTKRNVILRFAKNTISEMPDDGENGNTWNSMIDTILNLCLIHNYSLRKFEKIMTQFAVIIKFNSNKKPRVNLILFILCDLKITNRTLFLNAKNGTLNYAEISYHYKFNLFLSESSINLLRYYYDTEIDRNNPEWERFKGAEWTYEFDSIHEITMYLANEIVDKIG